MVTICSHQSNASGDMCHDQSVPITNPLAPIHAPGKNRFPQGLTFFLDIVGGPGEPHRQSRE